MLKKIIRKIFGKNLIFNFRLLYFNFTGNFFTNKPIGKQNDYQELYNNYVEKIKEYNFINNNFTNEEIEFINKLALKTQVVKKKSMLSWIHGFVIMKTLNEYIKDNYKSKIEILETGTAAGFSSVIMSYVLIKSKLDYKIYTIDLIPHHREIYWNRISDHTVGKLSRENLLGEYSNYIKNINFINGVSKKLIKKDLHIDRVNFAFIDGSHEYEDAKMEFEFVDRRNSKGDIIILDDYTPGKFDGIVKITNHIKLLRKYHVDIVNYEDTRGYVVCKKL